jgi:hypothetical protein
MKNVGLLLGEYLSFKGTSWTISDGARESTPIETFQITRPVMSIQSLTIVSKHLPQSDWGRPSDRRCSNYRTHVWKDINISKRPANPPRERYGPQSDWLLIPLVRRRYGERSTIEFLYPSINTAGLVNFVGELPLSIASKKFPPWHLRGSDRDDRWSAHAHAHLLQTIATARKKERDEIACKSV